MAYEDYRDSGDDRRYGRQQQDGGRDYRGAGELGGYERDGGRAYGERDAGRGYGQRDGGQSDYGRSDYGRSSYGQRDYASGDYARGDWGREGSGQRYGSRSYGQDDGRSTEGFNGGTDYYRGDRGRGWGESREASRARDTGSGDDRGFMARAGDEVRSWFGDDQAERRREQDARDWERSGGAAGGDHRHYHDWRDQQIKQFDRDYQEYHQENRQKFHNEFSSWRTERQGQRDQLGSVREHQEVVGSDGEHVGTVDKVRGDHVILTKNDADAGGRHHSFPSRWIKSVDDKVTLTKTAADAKREWQDAERGAAMFGGQDGDRNGNGEGRTDLNRSFSNTY